MTFPQPFPKLSDNNRRSIILSDLPPLCKGFWVFGDAHKIITFYPLTNFSFSAAAIFSPRFTEMLTDG
jgi:hypothetical protein